MRKQKDFFLPENRLRRYEHFQTKWNVTNEKTKKMTWSVFAIAEAHLRRLRRPRIMPWRPQTYHFGHYLQL
ncbi:MAG: hypothetical protein H0V72_28640 [Bradyrhizobium sp.]|nr:hypothetical protein [Bradyrhizobium sp.]